MVFAAGCGCVELVGVSAEYNRANIRDNISCGFDGGRSGTYDDNTWCTARRSISHPRNFAVDKKFILTA